MSEWWWRVEVFLDYSIRGTISQIARFLVRVNMPDHIVRQPDDLIARPFSHLRESFRFRLVFECIAREVDPW